MNLKLCALQEIIKKEKNPYIPEKLKFTDYLALIFAAGATMLIILFGVGAIIYSITILAGYKI